jgi:hypothetical protein
MAKSNNQRGLSYFLKVKWQLYGYYCWFLNYMETMKNSKIKINLHKSRIQILQKSRNPTIQIFCVPKIYLQKNQSCDT